MGRRAADILKRLNKHYLQFSEVTDIVVQGLISLCYRFRAHCVYCVFEEKNVF